MGKIFKKPAIILIVIAAIVISFATKFDSSIEDLKSIGNSKQSSINDFIVLSRSFMESMTIFGNTQFGDVQDSNYISKIKYNAAADSYNMDDIGGTELQKSLGNLTGIGNILKDGSNKRELNLIFEYTKYFNKFMDRLPDVAWLYYTSEKNFIYMYPWIASKDFMYYEALKKAEFYEYVSPEFNPQRIEKWTPVYMDHAGKGLMVTLSSPVYNNNQFMGVVSLDLTNAKLSEIINSSYESYLIDNTDSIIATTEQVDDYNVTTIDTMIKGSEADLKRMKEGSNGTVQRVGSYYVYTASFKDAPWRLLLLVPVYVIIGKAMLYTIPILLICFLLLLTYWEVENRKKTEFILQNIAVTDQLTGLNNRHCFDIKVAEEMQRSEKYDKPLSMIIFDLDFFKRINDHFGHPMGDEILKQCGEIITGALRKSDMLFRVGGEEFVVLLPGTDNIGALAVAEKLRSTLDNNLHSTVGKYTASFGVGERYENESLNIWYKKVDDALYKAKKLGRNRVVSSA